ncbi:MAG: hypothetical protein J6X65_02105 [Bacteroidales bacterium]|nr:hypothetical protein [Bacteroidales bacterium]
MNTIRTSRYRFGFDIWGLLLFLLVMLPNFIWFAVPAPDDILRTESVTPVVDIIGSVFQVLTVACLCFVICKERSKFRFSPLVVATVACLAAYYIGWARYYADITALWVILLLTLPPCLAFILFAIDRKNLPAVVSAASFTVCHCIFGVVNYL